MIERSSDLAGKVVVVTGAGHGIGRAVAERFAIEGARVVVNDVDQARADEVARALAGEAVGVRADVAKSSDVSALFDATLERFGTVDVLVNNAGNIYAARHFLEGDEAWWDQVLGVNLKGAFLCSKRAADVMAHSIWRDDYRASRRGVVESSPRGCYLPRFARYHGRAERYYGWDGSRETNPVDKGAR